jgi:hypothetical protein
MALTVPGLPSLLFDVDAVPRRSDLMLVCRLLKTGWRPDAALRAVLTSWAGRATDSNNPRLRSRGCEALAALGMTEPSSDSESPAERNLCDLGAYPVNGTKMQDRGGLHCPSCRSPSVHPRRAVEWVCSGCGDALRQRLDRLKEKGIAE